LSVGAVARRRRSAVLPIAVAVITAAAFLPSLQNDFVLWDDDMNFLENPDYRGLSWAHLRWAWTTTLGGHWHPLTWLSLAFDWTVWGMDARGYHLTSLALHVGNALWCFALARTLLARAVPGAAPRRVAFGAAAAALLFAVHPLRVESVAWASERRDVLSAFFWLPALLAYVRMTDAGGRARLGWAGLSLACLALSLLSKAWGMTFPAVLLVLDAYPLRRVGREPVLRLLAEKLPWIGLALLGAVTAFEAQHPVEAMRTLAHHGVAARTAQAAYGLCFYVVKSIVPRGLHPAYLLELQLDPTRPVYVAAVLAVALVTAALVALRRRAPWALAAWIAYAAIVSPVLGIAQTGPQIAADRYTYLATIPLALVVPGVGLATRAPGRLLATAGVVVVALLGLLTARQTRVWHDSATLWAHVLRIDPGNYVAWTNRGVLTGDPRQAAVHYTEAIRLNPRYTLAWANRGACRHALADYAGAAADYSEAIRLAPGDPKTWNNRGWARQAAGDWRGAAEDYAHALAISPPDWNGRALIETNLGLALRRLGVVAPPPSGIMPAP
jgi:protein O-mannosyl-transferase